MRRADAEIAADFRSPWARLGWLTGQLQDARKTLLDVEAALCVADPAFLLGLVEIEINGINRALSLVEQADLGAAELRARNDRASWAGFLRRLANDDPLPGEPGFARVA